MARFMTLVNGFRTLVTALVTSTGAADAGKIIATNSEGKLDTSLLPAGIGANVQILPSFENLGAGKFVNLFSDAGTFKVRLADNSNGRPAHGFIKEAVTAPANATVYPLDTNNPNLSALTVGSVYYLGVAGGVIAAPLDPLDAGNANKLHQRLGIAASATELITDDDSVVML